MSAPARRIAVFGATSDMASAFARRAAEEGARLVLLARDEEGLERIAADLSVRGALEVRTRVADFADPDALKEAAEAAWSAFDGLDVALIAYGSLPDQTALQGDLAGTEAALFLNFVSPAVVAGALAERFEAQRAGSIAVITSVAGDRGRQSNYIYGAAKGGLQRFLEGLRHRLHPAGVQVLDVRPGFVATKMTAHLAQSGPLWATPDKVAADMARALGTRRAVLYTPWFWWIIMSVVRLLPRPLFHRSKL